MKFDFIMKGSMREWGYLGGGTVVFAIGLLLWNSFLIGVAFGLYLAATVWVEKEKDAKTS